MFSSALALLRVLFSGKEDPEGLGDVGCLLGPFCGRRIDHLLDDLLEHFGHLRRDLSDRLRGRDGSGRSRSA